jgi:SET domain-containing protein
MGKQGGYQMAIMNNKIMIMDGYNLTGRCHRMQLPKNVNKQDNSWKLMLIIKKMPYPTTITAAKKDTKRFRNKRLGHLVA